jgi:hypothetical protein
MAVERDDVAGVVEFDETGSNRQENSWRNLTRTLAGPVVGGQEPFAHRIHVRRASFNRSSQAAVQLRPIGFEL